MTELEFRAWPKIARLNRDMIVTEKIDGTNAAVIVQYTTNCGAQAIANEVTEDGVGVHLTMRHPGGGFSRAVVAAQSRKKIITPGKQTDNHGFAGWVRENAQVLADTLGEGYHYGEWWGRGVQRGYGQEGKRFSLFNVVRYADVNVPEIGMDTVPIIYEGPFDTERVNLTVLQLAADGSRAAPGFMKPEGVVVFHKAAGVVFKVTCEKDEEWKGKGSS